MTALTADCVYKYLGVAVVVVFLLYLASRAFTIQLSFLNRMLSKEGFTDAASISPTIKSNSSKIDDPLIVSKYRKTYEQVIVDLDDNMKTYILSSVINHAEAISANPGSDESQKIITAATHVSDFRKTLNEAMAILNAHK